MTVRELTYALMKISDKDAPVKVAFGGTDSLYIADVTYVHATTFLVLNETDLATLLERITA